MGKTVISFIFSKSNVEMLFDSDDNPGDSTAPGTLHYAQRRRKATRCCASPGHSHSWHPSVCAGLKQQDRTWQQWQETFQISGFVYNTVEIVILPVSCLWSTDDKTNLKDINETSSRSCTWLVAQSQSVYLGLPDSKNRASNISKAMTHPQPTLPLHFGFRYIPLGDYNFMDKTRKLLGDCSLVTFWAFVTYLRVMIVSNIFLR